MDGKLQAIKENIESLLFANKESGLVVNTDKLRTWSSLEFRMKDEVIIYIGNRPF